MSNIEISALKAGDILLYHSTKSWISKAIRKLDGTEYNHAALFREGSTVVEALSQGVVENDINKSIANSNPVTVFRLKSEPSDMLPVLAVAKNYTGNRYAYEQIILLTVICLFRKIKMNNVVARIVGTILEKAALLLMNTFGIDGKDSLICSELVYRSYNEADKSSDTYKIAINRTSRKSGFTASEESFAEEGSLYERLFGNTTQIQLNTEKISFMSAEMLSDEDCEKLIDDLDNYTEEDLDFNTEQQLKAAAEHLFAVAAEKSEIQGLTKGDINIFDIIKVLGADNSDFVTPGDLYKSDSLQAVGNIC